MEGLKVFQLLAMLWSLLAITVNSQISSPCTGSVVTTFTPCMNYITGSTSNGSLIPTASCCNSVKSMMSSSMDCACLLLTANVPVLLPINRTLAISLPRACNMGSVPLQCKAAGTPLPAPGPALFASPPPSVAAAPLSPRASKAVALAPAPDSTEPLTPASPPAQAEAPTTTTTTAGIRPVLTPAVSMASYNSPSSFLLIVLAFAILK